MRPSTRRYQSAMRAKSTVCRTTWPSRTTRAGSIGRAHRAIDARRVMGGVGRRRRALRASGRGSTRGLTLQQPDAAAGRVEQLDAAPPPGRRSGGEPAWRRAPSRSAPARCRRTSGTRRRRNDPARPARRSRCRAPGPRRGPRGARRDALTMCMPKSRQKRSVGASRRFSQRRKASSTARPSAVGRGSG